MTDDDDFPEMEAARGELHDLLQRHADWFGPISEEDEDLPSPGDTVFLDRWVIVAAWTDVDGECFSTRIVSKGCPRYVRDGLLHQALFRYDD